MTTGIGKSYYEFMQEQAPQFYYMQGFHLLYSYKIRDLQLIA